MHSKGRMRHKLSGADGTNRTNKNYGGDSIADCGFRIVDLGNSSCGLRVPSCGLRVASFELRASREGAKGKGRKEDHFSDSVSDIDVDTEIFELEIFLMPVGCPHHNRKVLYYRFELLSIPLQTLNDP